MNNKITLNQLAERIAKTTGSNEQTAKAFVQDLTEIIAEALAKGKSVTIKGFGTFSVSDEGESPVIWRPDENLAENVNQPFAAFEPVELEDEVTEEILEGKQTAEPDAPTTQEPVETEKTTEDEPQPEEQPAEERPDTAHTEETTAETSAPEQTEAEEQPQEETDDEPQQPADEPDYEPEYDEPARKRSINPWLTLTIGLLAGFIIGYFSATYINNCIYEATEGETTPTDSIADQTATDITVADSVVATTADTVPESAEPAETTPAVVTDTVTPRRYLTTMSRKYYGDYRFWVYIYLENRDIITDPNRIKPGTAVVIPPAEKYGIDPDDPESVAKANEKIQSILANLDK